MWRTISVHEKKETEYLDRAIERLELDPVLRERAERKLKSIAQAEPLFNEALRTPQDPRHHAEGPFLEDHLRLILIVLYGIIEEKFHFIDIEEFRRMKAYHGEFDELEEILKENVALFEVFALAHDVGKWPTLSLVAKAGSRGAKLGFPLKKDHAWDAFGISERAKYRDRYLEMYQSFRAEHPHEPDQELQAQFFLSFGISAHYPGHNRVIHTPVYSQFLHRLAAAHRLPEKDSLILEDLIGRHLEPIHDFKNENSRAIGKYLKIAHSRGWDGDDFLDFLQAAVFLDAISGSKQRGPHGFWREHPVLTNFFRSEHAFAPERRVEKSRQREEAKKHEQNQAFRTAGLDGVALMDLLGMEPGPAFGRTLGRLQSAVLGKGHMPAFSDKIDEEISRRRTVFYEIWFEKDR